MRSKNPARSAWVVLIPLALAVLSPSCAHAPLYSELAYQNATSLRVDAQALMEHATEPFEAHKEDVARLRLDLQKAYEFSRGRPGNDPATGQWEILIDPKGGLLGGFLARREREGKLGAAFVEESKGQVGEAFSTISGLEIGRIKPGEVR